MTELKGLTIAARWKATWGSKIYRSQIITGILLLVFVFVLIPFFFQKIEQRNGYVLNDWILGYLPAQPVSLFIFVSIWSVAILAFVRMAQDPQLFIQLLWSYLFLTIMRICSISLVPLNPPIGLLELKDPISNFFYGHSYVTKDLFFSGHTSTVFLFYFGLKNKRDKFFALVGSMLVGFLLLLQHVHYSIDVFFAPLFSMVNYLIAKRILGRWVKN